MKASDLVTLPVRLGESSSLGAQPSLEEIVRGHYIHKFGPAGAPAADAYVEQIRSMIDAAAAAAAEPAPERAAGKPEEPSAEKPQRPSGPDLLETLGLRLELGGHDVLESMRKVGGGDAAALGPMLGGLLAAALRQGTTKRD